MTENFISNIYQFISIVLKKFPIQPRPLPLYHHYVHTFFPVMLITFILTVHVSISKKSFYRLIK